MSLRISASSSGVAFPVSSACRTSLAAEPSKTEFRRVLTDEQLGIPLEDALKVCIKRMDNKDLDQVALVAKLQRDMGSNSAEVLDKVVEAVRKRMELRRLIRALTAKPMRPPGSFSRSGCLSQPSSWFSWQAESPRK